jgi:methylated-DNA-[protein]-cysteine S-methyltransferase
MTRDSAPRFTSGTIDTPIGAVVLVVDENGALYLAEFADRPERVERGMQRLRATASELPPGEMPVDVRHAFEAYFDGVLAVLASLPIRLAGTAFQNRVWSALRHVPAGMPLAYGAFAERIGRPSASRAVGHANGANPLSIVVPCHRLVAADGSLTSYGGGLERKRWLLDHEARHRA